MMEEMDDSRVLFGLLRYELAPGQRKEIFITWAGEGAPAVVKGNLSKHTELVGKLFKVIIHFLPWYKRCRDTVLKSMQEKRTI